MKGMIHTQVLAKIDTYEAIIDILYTGELDGEQDGIYSCMSGSGEFSEGRDAPEMIKSILEKEQKNISTFRGRGDKWTLDMALADIFTETGFMTEDPGEIECIVHWN